MFRRKRSVDIRSLLSEEIDSFIGLKDD